MYYRKDLAALHNSFSQELHNSHSRQVYRVLKPSVGAHPLNIIKRVFMGSWRHFLRTGLGTPPALREIVGVVEDITGVGIDPGEPLHMFFTAFARIHGLSIHT